MLFAAHHALVILARSNSATAPSTVSAELVFRIFFVVLAADNDALFVFQQLADDYSLVDRLTRDTICTEEVHRVKGVGL